MIVPVAVCCDIVTALAKSTTQFYLT